MFIICIKDDLNEFVEKSENIVNYAKNGENPLLHEVSGELKIHAVVVNKMTELDISDLVADLEAGDYLGIFMYRAGTHVNDTIDADVVMLGAKLKFMRTL